MWTSEVIGNYELVRPNPKYPEGSGDEPLAPNATKHDVLVVLASIPHILHISCAS